MVTEEQIREKVRRIQELAIEKSLLEMTMGTKVDIGSDLEPRSGVEVNVGGPGRQGEAVSPAMFHEAKAKFASLTGQFSAFLTPRAEDFAPIAAACTQAATTLGGDKVGGVEVAGQRLADWSGETARQFHRQFLTPFISTWRPHHVEYCRGLAKTMTNLQNLHHAKRENLGTIADQTINSLVLLHQSAAAGDALKLLAIVVQMVSAAAPPHISVAGKVIMASLAGALDFSGDKAGDPTDIGGSSVKEILANMQKELGKLSDSIEAVETEAENCLQKDLERMRGHRRSFVVGGPNEHGGYPRTNYNPTEIRREFVPPGAIPPP